MELEFNSLEELFNHIKPALNTKKAEMKRNGYDYIKIEDIWNYFKEVKWKKANDLSISEMVSDILNTNDSQIDLYLKQKLNLTDRKIYFKEEKDDNRE
ncbi:MAG: hypothetical protein J6B98_05110 [Bacilli bacterium]|nr:hypothetical protein [Bacilli bacterium]